jgi:hypothetical protein
MEVEIINKRFKQEIFGYSGTAINQDYAGTAFKLMDRMWKTVKEKNLTNKGNNIWVYDADEKVFAGVELINAPDFETGLQFNLVELTLYAYYKHVGPYALIKQAGQSMRHELKKKGYETSFPYVEIYGHWTKDETKLETELLMSLSGS